LTKRNRTNKLKTSTIFGQRKARTPKNLTKNGAKANAVSADLEIGTNQADRLARAYLSPTMQAGFTVQAYHSDSKSLPDMVSLVHALDEQVDAVSGGDLSRLEAILIAQAHSLDAISGCMARRAVMNIGKCLGAVETYLKLALRAQNQCRATAETLAMIKNPPNVSFVRQANIANGPQQVNNDVPRARTRARAREIENEQSKLSGRCNELSEDTRTPAFTGGIDSKVATVGTVDRAQDGDGQRTGFKERQ